MTQAQKVLEHLKEGHPITSLEALRRYGIIQLPRRIFDIRRMGYSVPATLKTVRNRDGEKTRVAEYRLSEGPR